MNPGEHDGELLSIYLLGERSGLEEHERRSVEEHLAGCGRCQDEQAGLEQMTKALGEVPPEAFLDGPPDDGELVLHRALHRVRAESARGQRRRRGAIAGLAAAVVLVAAGGGVLVGRGLDRPAAVDAARSPASQAPSPPAGTEVGSQTDPVTGARLTVRVVPAAGWVRVTAAVAGIPEGERCRLWVLAHNGTRELAGSWLVSERGAQEGTTLDGSALLSIEEVAAVEVTNDAGQTFVSVRL
jgi:hypothetical protein